MARIRGKGIRLISIDFDGTIVNHAFPAIGDPIPDAFEVMKELQDTGYGLILCTCREDEPNGKYLTEAVEFCKQNGITFRSVNCNLPEDDFRPPGGRKVFAHVYIDDRNFGGFPGWRAIRKELITNKEINSKQLAEENIAFAKCIHDILKHNLALFRALKGQEANTIHITPWMEIALAVYFQHNYQTSPKVGRPDLRSKITIEGMLPVWDAPIFELDWTHKAREALEKLDPRIKD